jgi:hypothetical protein
VIALFYSSGLEWGWVVAGAGVVVAFVMAAIVGAVILSVSAGSYPREGKSPRGP